MRVFVTGGLGRIGRVTVQRLLDHNHEVCVIDALPESDIQGITYARCDITDFEALSRNMAGCDAVIHLAAYPSPTRVPGQEVFRVNVTGTYNVFEAAAKNGIRRVAQASSINALGSMWWGTMEPDIKYFPIDENHPSDTTDPYSFSKYMIEHIGDYFWRRDGISSVAFRLPAVWTHEMVVKNPHYERTKEACKLLDKLAALPPEESAKQINGVKSLAAQFRSQRYQEYEAIQAGNIQTPQDDWLWNAYTFGRFNLWTYIDVMDAAQALEKAITADYKGSHVLFANATHNQLEYDLNTLLRLFFPEVSERKSTIEGALSPITIDKARELIGFEPEFRLTYSQVVP